MIKDVELEFEVGWSNIYQIGILFGVNILMMLYTQVCAVKRKCKLRSLKKA